MSALATWALIPVFLAVFITLAHWITSDEEDSP